MSCVETRFIAADDRIPTSRSNIVSSSAVSVDSAAGAAHDLGNLIQIAASALNIISRSPAFGPSSTLEPVAASAKIALQRAGTLIQQTLRLAREGNAAVEPVSTTACLVELEALVKGTWESSVRFDLKADPNLPTVTCNRLGLQSAIMNLLLNARDAMPNGGEISVVATAAQEQDGAAEVEVRVTDNGLGMTQDTMLRAFEPYFTTKTTGLGGFGLSMVKRFVDEAGGRLDIDSEPGVGTTVTLRLPVSGSEAG
jgi:signal transduction histidine kinase